MYLLEQHIGDSPLSALKTVLTCSPCQQRYSGSACKANVPEMLDLRTAESAEVVTRIWWRHFLVFTEVSCTGLSSDTAMDGVGEYFHRVFISPVVGSKPVQRCVQLDDVGAEENIVSNLTE